MATFCWFISDCLQRIITILLRRGRLPIHPLSRHTRLSKRQLKHGLAVLIQQHLVYFHEQGGITYYEANIDATYGLVRSGKYLEVVASKYGTVARDLVHNLFLMGHACVSDLLDAYTAGSHHVVEILTGQFPANGTNGHHPSSGELHAILIKLLEAGFLQPVHKAVFRSPTDTLNDLETEILRGNYDGSAKGPKQKEQLKEDVRRRLKELRSEAPGWTVMKGKKRALNGETSNSNGDEKRRKTANGKALTNGTGSHEDEEGDRLEPGLILHINHEKFTVALRNDKLVELANARIGPVTSRVYAELLRLLEAEIPRCQIDSRFDDPDDYHGDQYTITTKELFIALGESINVSLGIGKAENRSAINTRELDKPQEPKKRTVVGEAGSLKIENGDEEGDDADMIPPEAINGNGEVQQDDDLDDPFADKEDIEFRRMEHLKNHLRLLAADNVGLIRLCGPGEWTVDFPYLADYLRNAEIDSYILDTFGAEGHRLVQMMRRMGKVEEKQLPHLALMKKGDIHKKLAEMQMAGMVDIQGIPRDANHTNARMIFLWHFDAERVSSMLLNKLYKAMSRHLQRVDMERRKASGILAISRRSDVTSGQVVLTEVQAGLLQDIRDKEEKFIVQLSRIDGLVAIFRDY